jgi:rod shape-determining protein MreC
LYDRKVIRRRRIVLGALVACSLALITAYFGESAGGGLHAIQNGANEVLGPIESGASRAVKPVADLVGWTGDVLSAKGDNKSLKKEVERLRSDLARAQAAQREVEQLRGIVKLRESDGFPKDAPTVAARVTVRSATAWYSTIQIDKGSSDGIATDQPVITAGGLLGKVSAVTSNTARVRLITDDQSYVSAQVMPEGANGIVRPTVGDPNDLLLDYIQKDRKVTEGTTVMTSGFKSSRLESIYPRGIPIGTVTRVDPSELEQYTRVHVKPFVDFRRVDFVQVLTGKGTSGGSGNAVKAQVPGG